MRRGDAERALEALEDATSWRPRDSDLLEHLGNAYLQTGQLDRAKIAYDRALKFMPNQPALHLMRGRILGLYALARARTADTRATELVPRNPQYRRALDRIDASYTGDAAGRHQNPGA